MAGASGGNGRLIAVAFLQAFGLFVCLVLAMAIVTSAGLAEGGLNWPMIAAGLACAFYLAAIWQFIRSLTWFLIGLLLWCVICFGLLLVLPEWIMQFTSAVPAAAENGFAQ